MNTQTRRNSNDPVVQNALAQHPEASKFARTLRIAGITSLVALAAAVAGPRAAYAQAAEPSAPRANLIQIDDGSVNEAATKVIVFPAKAATSAKVDRQTLEAAVNADGAGAGEFGTPPVSGVDASVPAITSDTTYGDGYDQIDPAYELDYWGLDVQSGQRLTIRASRTNGDLDGWISLFDPYGNEVAYDDDSAGSLNPQVRHDATMSGSYTIRVNSWNLRTMGGYHLEIWAETDTPPPSCNGSHASIGDAVTGYAGGGNTQTFCFNGSGGRWVSIRAVQLGGNLDTVLALYDSSNNQIGFNDDTFGYDLNSMLVAYLPSNGTYRLEVSGYGSTAGSFRAHLGLNRKATVADANSTCSVDSGDQWLVQHFLGTSSYNDETWHADVNLDGFVNGVDYAYVMSHWGNGC